jgi:carboxymethylenebutenolidase
LVGGRGYATNGQRWSRIQRVRAAKYWSTAWSVNRDPRNLWRQQPHQVSCGRLHEPRVLDGCACVIRPLQPNLELGYGPEDRKKGVQAASQLGPEMALKDVQASIEYARDQLGMRVGVLGFCWGGTVAWLAATRLQPDAVVAYYGGQIAKHSAEKPRCPVQLHFGKLDAHIPMSEIDAIRRHHPEVPIFLYDAGHGFNCDQRESYEPVSAALARQRTLQFLQENL